MTTIPPPAPALENTFKSFTECSPISAFEDFLRTTPEINDENFFTIKNALLHRQEELVPASGQRPTRQGVIYIPSVASNREGKLECLENFALGFPPFEGRDIGTTPQAFITTLRDAIRSAPSTEKLYRILGAYGEDSAILDFVKEELNTVAAQSMLPDHVPVPAFEKKKELVTAFSKAVDETQPSWPIPPPPANSRARPKV